MNVVHTEMNVHTYSRTVRQMLEFPLCALTTLDSKKKYE